MPEPDYSGVWDNEVEFALGPESLIKIPLAVRPAVMRQEAAEILNGARFIYLSGRIKYTDVFKQEHATAFWHRYNAETNSFEPWGGPEHNRRT